MTKTYIISAERSNLSVEDNAARTADLRDMLLAKGWDVLPVVGCYNGDCEHSFMVRGVNDSDKGSLLDLMGISNEFQQECIMEVCNDHKVCYLVYPDGDDDFIGHWTQIDPEGHNGWTSVVVDGQARFYAAI